ncbi:hypothetical protein [Terriglobus sp.]|uniref:hypothetical protein n=1 Tax=Terriglobus sp. TaxID=1889013 RepID=UPI003AFFEF80
MDFHDTPPVSSAARAAIVNRTHRVVRERAMEMQQRNKSRRELVLPLLICSAVLLLVCYAGWVVASGTGFVAVGSEIEQEAGKLFTGQTMDTGSPAFLLLLWFLPVTVATVAVVYLRRKRSSRDRGRDGAALPLDGRFRDEVTR